MKRLTQIMALRRIAAPLAAVALLSSCSMMHDDLPECAVRPKTRANIHFAYDYNTLAEDHFIDNVGSVTLYICSEDGMLLQQIEHVVTPEEIEAGSADLTLDIPLGKYNLYAAAHATNTSYEEYLKNPGASFRRANFAENTSVADFFISLDHKNGLVEHQQTSLEHFWLTRHATELEVPEAPMPAEGAPQPDDMIVEATVNLQRITNNLHLTLVKGEPATRAEQINLDHYEVWVESTSGVDRLNLTGAPAKGAVPLKYTPHRTAAATTPAGLSAIVADIAVSRLFAYDDPAKNARLYVHSKESNETFSWDLPELLSKGLEAYGATGWSKQEYLDREYEYTLSIEFNEKDDGWRYIDLNVLLLNWSKRIQNVEL